MLINGTSLVGCPVLNLHIGGEAARVVEPIVDPNNLKIIAFRVEGKLVNEDTGDILPIERVREFSRMGMVIDSADDFAQVDDIIKVKEIVDLNFSLIGLKVVTRSNSKLGKVLDYTVEVGGWAVQQIIVQRPALKAIFDPELIIARNKIVEVDDYKVVIKDEHDKVKSKVKEVSPAEFVPNFINPFREPDYASEKQQNS